jgi:hypothetical protein
MNYVGNDWAYRRAAWCALDEKGSIEGEGMIPADEDGLARDAHPPICRENAGMGAVAKTVSGDYSSDVGSNPTPSARPRKAAVQQAPSPLIGR